MHTHTHSFIYIYIFVTYIWTLHARLLLCRTNSPLDCISCDRHRWNSRQDEKCSWKNNTISGLILSSGAHSCECVWSTFGCKRAGCRRCDIIKNNIHQSGLGARVYIYRDGIGCRRTMYKSKCRMMVHEGVSDMLDAGRPRRDEKGDWSCTIMNIKIIM